MRMSSSPRLFLPRVMTAALVVAVVAVAPARVGAAVLTWTATLSGGDELPPTSSAATGSGTVEYDTVSHTLAVDLDWAGLTGDGVQAHIHCCVTSPPANTGIALDLWLTPSPRPASGSYSAFYDLDVDNPFRGSFVLANGGTTASAFAALMASMTAGEGRAYFNIHTVMFPGGEIRGNLAPVPEPASLWLLLGGLGAAALRRRSSRERR